MTQKINEGPLTRCQISPPKGFENPDFAVMFGIRNRPAAGIRKLNAHDKCIFTKSLYQRTTFLSYESLASIAKTYFVVPNAATATDAIHAASQPNKT
ncbi:hypothetical protein FG05_30307 [Fusarium graminearum]|nr:hypothetical protein FG05_30307 [Fusarium graminearum]